MFFMLFLSCESHPIHIDIATDKLELNYVYCLTRRNTHYKIPNSIVDDCYPEDETRDYCVEAGLEKYGEGEFVCFRLEERSWSVLLSEANATRDK